MWRYYCRNCGTILEYNQSQIFINCPRCGKDDFPGKLDEIKTRFCDGKLYVTPDGDVRAFPGNGKLNVRSLVIPEGARTISTYYADSAFKDNPYIEEITFPSTINEIYKYIARSNVGGMRVQGKRIIYPSNPFLDDVNDGVLTLINPVSSSSFISSRILVIFII